MIFTGGRVWIVHEVGVGGGKGMGELHELIGLTILWNFSWHFTHFLMLILYLFFFWGQKLSLSFQICLDTLVVCSYVSMCIFFTLAASSWPVVAKIIAKKNSVSTSHIQHWPQMKLFELKKTPSLPILAKSSTRACVEGGASVVRYHVWVTLTWARGRGGGG